MASALAFTSFSLTEGPNESQLFQPMGGVGANMVSAARAALVTVANAVTARIVEERIRADGFIRNLSPSTFAGPRS